MKQKEPKQVPRRLLYPTGEVCILLCCSINFLRDELNAGRLGFVVRSNRRYVPATELEKYVAQRMEGGCEHENQY